MIDGATFLCLTCSSSLPPRRVSSKAPVLPTGASQSNDEIFITRCCNRPICPACIAANPRLARYDPCLRCLGGVGAVSASSSASVKALGGQSRHTTGQRVNVDGAMRDEDVFVLGDDELDDAPESTDSAIETPTTPPPAYAGPTAGAAGGIAISSTIRASVSSEALQESVESDNEISSDPDKLGPRIPAFTPPKYCIKANDTLIGIALKFGIDGRLLCRLNGLPPTTLRTTPHLLHTRTFLTLPPSARIADPGVAKNGALEREDTEYHIQRARERAEKRLQVLTKETDWRVAKAQEIRELVRQGAGTQTSSCRCCWRVLSRRRDLGGACYRSLFR
ncbi:hypothetical protein AcV5_008543 [Taiwanofungus camphoratus]|nr:hypothetical protein AcV5_008543 [Antrodia cinnamomea]KAI0956018.1 hypothetical protein AcV7_006532 [Antrodia cinnamomea]